MKKAFRIIGVILLVVIVVVAGLAGYAYYKLKNIKDTHDLQAKIERDCKKFIAEKKGTGLAVGIIQGGRVYVVGHGYADKENKIPVDSNTVFEIGSITKVFTSELAQILADRGELDWNSTISANLPDSLRPPADDSTTLLNLATHTSGYPRMPQALLDKMKNDCNPYADLSRKDFDDYLKNSKDKARPNAANYDYSNTGASILGNIVEVRSGKPYGELLEAEICSKLEMANTGLVVKDSARFATGYDEKGNKTCHWDFPVMYGAGAIRSNIADMMKFAKANISDNPLYHSFAQTQQQIYKTPMGGIGKGWHIDHMEGALFGLGDIVWHNGGTGGFSSYMGLLPKSKVAIVVLSNQSSRELDGLAIKLLTMAGKISLAP